MCRLLVAAVALLSLTPTAALANEFSCTQTFNDAEVLIVDNFPATVKVKLTVTNTHPTETSVASAILAPMLEALWFTFQVPLTLSAGASFVSERTINIANLGACRQLAYSDGQVDGTMASPVEISWQLGSTHCSGAIVCREALVCR